MKTVLDEYEARFAKHGDTAQGHGWGNEASVAIRRTALLSVFGGERRPFTALDFGCGSGDFSEDLEKCGMTEYVGVEAVPAIREVAQQRYPQHRFVESLPEGTWDYVFVSGTFNLKMEIVDVVWEAWVERQIRKLWNSTRVALVMNFMTWVPDWKAADLWYPDCPEQIVGWVQPRRHLVLEKYGLRGEWTLFLKK